MELYSKALPAKMHALQQKHSKLKPEETAELLKRLNISSAQLPKIKSTDPALPKNCKFGDVIKIERVNVLDEEKKKSVYYRTVV